MTENDSVPSWPILSVNVGRKKTESFKGKEAVSGIYKQPAEGAAHVSPAGVSGDEVADLVHHGGPDKAVNVYSHVHYPHWEDVLGREMAFGAFGENLTVGGLREEDVCVGDVFRAGTALLQISQPRVPCWKLAMKWGLDELPALVTQSGATGFYFRVLEEGGIRAGDVMTLERRHPSRVSVAEANRVMHRDRNDQEGIGALLALEDVLAMSWITPLASRLARLQTGS